MWQLSHSTARRIFGKYQGEGIKKITGNPNIRETGIRQKIVPAPMLMLIRSVRRACRLDSRGPRWAVDIG